MISQPLTIEQFETQFGPFRVFNSYGSDVAAVSPDRRWTLNLEADGSIVALAAGSDCNFMGWCITARPAVSGEEVALLGPTPEVW